jgi:hypothetical protein
MPNFSDGGIFGSVILKKTAGTAGAFVLNTQVGIPMASVQPIRARNISYPGCINATDSVSVSLAGNIMPAVSVRTYMKPSFLTASLVNSLILATDAVTKLSDEWAMQIKSQYVTRVYSKMKCAGIVFTQAAQNGPIAIDMQFVAIYGQDYSGTADDPSPPTFTAFTTDAGAITNKSQVVFNATADQVKGWSLALSRIQAPQFSDTGVLFAEAISSGAFGGALSLSQAPTNTISPSSAITIQLGSAGAGIQLALNLNLDGEYTPQDLGFLVGQRAYTLANLSTGAIPCTVTAL